MNSRIRRGALALIACAMIAVPALAQEIKISHQFKANTDGRDKATRVFVEEVNKKDPSLKFRIYPGSSLNIKPVAQFDALQSGTLEMAVFPMSYAVGKVPEMSITIMPGTITSLDHAHAPEGHGLPQEAAGSRREERRAHRHLVVDAGRLRLQDPRDRRPGHGQGREDARRRPTFESMLKAAGASVINMPSTEIYPSLQSGRARPRPLTSAETFVSMRIYEQTKFATVGGDYTLWWLLQPLVMSKAAWDKLTPAQRKIFEEAADKSDDFFAAGQREAVEEDGRRLHQGRREGARPHQARVRRLDRPREEDLLAGVRREVRRREAAPRADHRVK